LILSGSPCEYIGSLEFLEKLGEIEEVDDWLETEIG
jgi:hypothetical protein